VSETEKIPVERPKRKLWKIVVPAIVVIILIPVLMYIYGYVALGDAYQKSWTTIDTSEMTLPDQDSLDQTNEYSEEVPIHNPTATNIRFIKINFDSWADGKKFATVRETDIYLPAGGSTTLTYTLYFDSELMEIIRADSFESKTRHEIEVSTNIFFITVTRSYNYESVETKYNIW